MTLKVSIINIEKKIWNNSSQMSRLTRSDPGCRRRQLLAILASGDRSQQLSRITVPTLVIHGEDDPLLPLSAGKEVAELINGARFMSLPKMGHDLTPIHLETIADAIARPLSGLQSVRRGRPAWPLSPLQDAAFESCDEYAAFSACSDDQQKQLRQDGPFHAEHKPRASRHSPFHNCCL